MAVNSKVIVVGGGLAGLGAALKIAEKGVHVDMVSLVPMRRSHSVCAQGGINAAVNLKGENDSPEQHFYDTIKGGDFLAEQPPVRDMAYAAPGIIHMLDRMGVTFNRTPEGNLDFRRFGGTLYHRTAFAGATTGQQLIYALDEQVRKHEAEGLVTKYEFYEVMRVVLDSEGICRGVVIMDLNTLELSVLKADAVIFATGGPGLIFGRSTNSVICTGAANARAYMQGAIYANGEFIQIHPTAIPGQDKLRLISESARGEGGRVWVEKEGQPWYFLEERYPRFGNLVPRDIGAREIFQVCKQGLGIGGGKMVYLDLTHKDADELDRKLKGILSIYEKFVGDDPRKVPMKIFPAVHYSMGGMWVDYPEKIEDDGRYRQMSSIRGLFNAGESDHQYHGANRLGANSLLSCIFGGFVAGPESMRYLDHVEKSYVDLPEAMYDDALKIEEARKQELLKADGPENVYSIWKEMGEMMTYNVTVERNNKDLAETLKKLDEYADRYKKIGMLDRGTKTNQVFAFSHQMESMIELAKVITKGALERNESRGAHFKEEFPDRDDENWMKTTLAKYTPDGPELSYEPVPPLYIEPVLRNYK